MGTIDSTKAGIRQLSVLSLPEGRRVDLVMENDEVCRFEVANGLLKLLGDPYPLEVTIHRKSNRAAEFDWTAMFLECKPPEEPHPHSSSVVRRGDLVQVVNGVDEPIPIERIKEIRLV